jgi:alginate O-acetyltransferase complex protein AlgI
MLLLAASYYFYMCWKVEYIALIIASTLIDYFTGLQMERKTTKKEKRPYLLISLLSNLGLLFVFKYFNFFSASLNSIFSWVNLSTEIKAIDLLLPVGISFYTFQTLSYSIDVYLGKQKAEKHLGYFALYVAYFPQLVAGPIERFSRLTPQLKAHHKFSFENLKNGLRLILYGLFIKMVIADNLSPFVDKIYAAPADYSSASIASGIFLYAYQIYCDFFGYSIIAIGSALIMGVKIMDNFKTPYLSTSIGEFWQRWHISLSSWFRDYLYFPLGGNKTDKGRWVINILIVFIVSGLWHGASWTFIIWGALYGLFYLIEKQLPSFKNISPYSIKHILLALKTFIIVTFIWVFFRSQNLSEVATIFSNLIAFNSTGADISLSSTSYLMLFLFIVSDIVLYNKRFDSWINNFPIIVRWSIYSFLIFSIIAFAGVENFSFIYFQF